MIFHIYTDGGARGNPGIAGFGVVIYNQNHHLIHQESKFLGIKTNNEAEYLALISALTWIKEHLKDLTPQKLLFYSDSQLLVRQLQGSYRVKAAHLKTLHSTAKLLLDSINTPSLFQYISRGSNNLADKLANLAMDQPYET
jgi:ribonuclease HI